MITLPKLKKIEVRPKIILLSDDIRLTSGIATMSREFVIGTCDTFSWVQLAAALNHPDHGKVFDMSEEIGKEAGVENANVKLYAHSGYGNPNVLREILSYEKPNAIMFFTDPRFWGWLMNMEYELHTVYKIPLIYYNIWDDAPHPRWNFSTYKSCDLIMNISRQTHQLVKGVLTEENYIDLDEN
jgi:hypothetical protein